MVAKTEVKEEPVAVKTEMKKEANKFSPYFSEDESDEDFQPTKRKKVRKYIWADVDLDYISCSV